MKKYLKDSLVLLVLCLPFLVYAVLMGVYGAPFKSIIKETIFNGAVLTFLLSVIYVTNNKIIKALFTGLLLFFYTVLYVQTGVLFMFHNFIDNAILYTAFETNYQEIVGFLNSYVKWYYAVFIIVYFYVVVRIVFFYSFFLMKNRTVLIILGIVCLGAGYRFYERSVTLLIMTNYLEYKEFSSRLSQNITKKTSDYFANVKNDEDEALYVVIIGESTSRRNMGIYGYYRDTNPELNKIKNELYLFEDVISPRTHTILSLDRVLSMGDYKNPDHNELGTVLQLANQAGFKTYWLSNQHPLGVNETLVSLYAKASDEQYFTTETPENEQKTDEILFPVFDKVIQDTSSSKKVVFLHLKGTHIYYKDAYPPSFEYFEDRPQTKFPSKEAFQTINDYDNAVRYNDYIVSEIIRKVRTKGKNSYVVYFSDHGDDVYQDTDFFGHPESIGSDAMYQIPFMVWLSEEYKQNNRVDFKDKLRRKYILEDFIHSFSELSRIQFDQFQPEKSIFNDQFVYKKRLISSGVNYDER